MYRSIASLRLVTLLSCAMFAAGGTAVAGPVRADDATADPQYRLYSREIACLAKAVYFEARGEPYSGQRLVAKVILNRVGSDYYPDTVCDVVYQNDHMKNACQFSFACDGIPDRIAEPSAYRKARKVAADALSCNAACRATEPPIDRSTHYHADRVSPWWAAKLRRTGKVGQHVFYYTASM